MSFTESLNTCLIDSLQEKHRDGHRGDTRWPLYSIGTIIKWGCGEVEGVTPRSFLGFTELYSNVQLVVQLSSVTLFWFSKPRFQPQPAVIFYCKALKSHGTRPAQQTDTCSDELMNVVERLAGREPHISFWSLWRPNRAKNKILGILDFHQPDGEKHYKWTIMLLYNFWMFRYG